MKILYAIQGTGNGHLARAIEIVPILQEMGETDVLVSGIQGDLKLPFPVKYKLYGISFIFGTNGGVNLLKTCIKMRPFRFIKDLFRLPVLQYDLIISDFEPVSAWACKLKGKKCIGISHQNAVLHPNAPKPNQSDWFGKIILKNYAPVNKKYGFHFKALDEFNSTPVIRPAIRNAKPKNKGHYTVYLPAYSNIVIENVLLNFKEVQWEVFSKHNKHSYENCNVRFQPVSLEGFNESFINCEGILCNSGFETPAEALFMGKKLCVIPMKNQYEQACNAAFLAEIGITVLSEFGLNNLLQIEFWLLSKNKIQVQYPDKIKGILYNIVYNSDLIMNYKKQGHHFGPFLEQFSSV